MTEYVNPHGIRFRIVESTRDPTQLIVKYYTPGMKWPHILHTYTCSTDEMRSEMFYIINQIRFCTLCNVNILDRENPTRSVCLACTMKQVASGTPEENIPECPVCYKKMLRVDGSKQKLVCNHELCATCMRRISRPSNHIHYDMQLGPMMTMVVCCPMCRTRAYYDYSLRHLPMNATI